MTTARYVDPLSYETMSIVEDLALAYGRLSVTPVVDDEFPLMRDRYTAALAKLIKHCTVLAPARLTFAEFARVNRLRSEAEDGFNHRLGDWSLSDWMTATMGELGEAANVAKKLNRVRDGVAGNTAADVESLRDQLRREIGDVGCYLDLMAQSQGFSLEDAMKEVFNNVSDRIGYKGKDSKL